MAGPSGGGSFNGPSSTRRHGLSRFSLARLFNISSYTHRTTGQRCSSTFESDRRSESSSIGLNVSAPPKAQQGSRDSTRVATAGPSSSSSESHSLRNGTDENKDTSQDPKKEFLECPVCLFELPHFCFPELRSCNHRACHNCLQQYLKIEITDSRVNVSCPECTEPIHPSDISMILNDEVLLGKYEQFMLRRVLITEPDARWCPSPDCGYAVIARGCAGCPKLKCERPGCNTYFCYHCKQEWHPNQTCDAARAQRAHHYTNPRSASVSFSQDSIVQTGDDIKPCPCCKILIIKMDDGSCNHMTCSVCGTEFCWLCMKEISDLHYLSPSGCTFWGKKPWSRKKKIMWQLGMLVGAPIGIALIAGIAVPAIIIGIPVWVGRKLHAKYTQPVTSRHGRNLIVTSGVMASILVSPILAGIAVGIGVPILLAYVYGVVPISLCRSGGCGVSTSASGVRIEFDEENEMGLGNTQSAGNYDGASVDTTASQRGVNPSIGEVSLGMSASLSLGSGSHLDRITLNRDRESDRESASNVALAGSIASASLLAGASKLEVQADVSSNKRFSLSSHSETASATVSLSERSAIISLADDASTKALAGSILGYRDSSAVTPVEVHVDAHNQEDMRVLDIFSKEQSETNSTVSEYYHQSASASESLESGIPLYATPGDVSHHASVRLKLSKSGKKRNRGNAVLEDVESGFHKSSDTVSVQSETYILPGHVHFNELKECCVSFIDESPSTDSLIKPIDSNSDTEVFVTNEGQGFKKIPNKHRSCSFGRQQLSTEDNSIRSSDAKCVTRSISFCNSCTSTHRSCCPSIFQGEAEDKNANANQDSNSKLLASDRFSKLNALSNRAYKVPCSMQDVSVDLTAKDNFVCNSSTIVPAASLVIGPFSHEQASRGIECCQLNSRSYPRLYRQEKDNRTNFCSDAVNFETVIVDNDFFLR